MKKGIMCLVVAFAVCACLAGCSKYVDAYEITDIAQYEEVKKEERYQEVEEYTALVMPKMIEAFFNVKKYSFKYDPIDGKHEEYLEITIDDEEEYQQYVTELLKGKTTETFALNEAYRQCVINDEVTFTTLEQGEQCIFMVNIQKILICDSTQTIIFLSFVTPNDYGAVEFEWSEYFSKFYQK